ncbi:MAG: trypsin-like serine protease [Elusimicrobiaceae bacterium]|nr:trypsin-like serine protease [Elusimicrobiaceae bacterium]
MKKLLFLLLVSCTVLLFAKTEIPVMQKAKQKEQIQDTGAATGNNGAGKQSGSSALDEPFFARHVYPGTNISKNVIPISFGANDHICSAFRFRRNWILTAAHCMENAVTVTTNQRIYSTIEKQDNGLMRAVFGQPDAQHPANANVYFYKQGYSSNSNNASGHSDDIALIRLDEADTSIATAQANMTRAAKEIQQTQAQIEQILPSGNPLLTQVKQTDEFFQKEQGRLDRKQKVRRDFLNQSLDDYHFFILDPVQAGELNNRSAVVVRFKEQKIGSSERKYPDAYVWKYKGQRNGADRILGWFFNQEDVATSGSPVIINGFVVSNTSGPNGKNTRETPLYTEQFHQFLVTSMGAEYPKGLCVQPVSEEPLPAYNPKK